MKLIIITSIKEDRENVTRILEEAGIAVFSFSETLGHKSGLHENLKDNWFFGGHDESTAALVFFSFTEEDKVAAALELVKVKNKETQSGFPIRAFVLPVESFAN